jgi:serine/threonine protein kinase
LARKSVKKKIPFEKVKIIVNQLISMIQKLQSANRNVQNFNPSNIFISKDGKLKLLNFCLGKKFEEFFRKSKSFLNGDPLYMAPEIISKGQVYPESEIWSLGKC